MDQDFEFRWCKFCMGKTKQEIIFISKMSTYKRRRHVDTKVGCKEEDHRLKVFIEKFSDQNFYFEKKIVDD